MLQTRRGALSLARRPYRCQWRGYADTKPPDPTNSVREPDNKPVNEPIGVCLQFDSYLASIANDAHRVEIAAVLTLSTLRLLAAMSQPTMHLTRNLTTKALVYETSLLN